MENIVIPLPEGKYISEIEPFISKGIETDTIYLKEIPGCGFTQFAIRVFKQNLILIEPNVPVIEDKEFRNNEEFTDCKILGVYKGVDVDDVREYLLSDVEFKKIVTTPEGFVDKVVKAFKNSNDMYEQYFLLFDECERIITDVSYRGNIAAPINEFFKFKNKAMVSATVLPFSDERFKDFKYYKIEPTYDYSKPLTVIGTNSVLTSFKKRIDEMHSNHICIFFNSTAGINAIIKNLDIEAQSKVFCAQDSVIKLLEKGYKNASSYLDVKHLVKYNFFTSRYFSAIDMRVKYKPEIIMITDVLFAEHSILDPHTEVIQISGRFRNGTNTLTHITNFDPQLKSMSNEEALYYLNGCFDTYIGFVESHAKSTNPGSRDILKKAIDDSPANSFYMDGNINTFMVDNFINAERVKGYYQNFENLQNAYNQRLNHFQLTFVEENCVVGDNDLLNLQGRKTKKEKYRVVAQLFENWKSKDGSYIIAPEDLKSRLIAKYPEIWEASLYLDPPQLEETGFVMSKIKFSIKKARELDMLKFLSIKVYKIFKEFKSYDEHFIREKLSKIFNDEGIIRKVGAATILFFFFGGRSTLKGEHVYVLKEKKFLDFENVTVQDS